MLLPIFPRRERVALSSPLFDSGIVTWLEFSVQGWSILVWDTKLEGSVSVVVACCWLLRLLSFDRDTVLRGPLEFDISGRWIRDRN